MSDNDCDDGDNTIYPSAPEICDGQVNECGKSLPSNEIDNDSDGYVECTLDPNGWDGSGSKSGDDCDDGDNNDLSVLHLRFVMVKQTPVVVLYL